MATATDLETGFAYDTEGSGTPVVLLHGLTFDRRTWRPIIEELDGSVLSIAIDLRGTAAAAAGRHGWRTSPGRSTGCWSHWASNARSSSGTR